MMAQEHVYALAVDVRATTPLLWAFEKREKLLELPERVSGCYL